MPELTQTGSLLSRRLRVRADSSLISPGMTPAAACLAETGSANRDRCRRPGVCRGVGSISRCPDSCSIAVVESIVVRTGVKECRLAGPESLSAEASDAWRGWLLWHHCAF